jgi:HD-GYP domain-containing protein (c-di-GMP phosphodiesterase class II)/CHASE2 domain-containing sensor protein
MRREKRRIEKGLSFLSEPRWFLFMLLLVLFWGANAYLRPLPLERLERLVFDWNLTAEKEVDGTSDTVLITIGEASLQKLGRWPWPRSVHAELIHRLQAADIVLLDILFPETSEPAEDAALIRAVADHGRVVTAEHLVAEPENGVFRLIPPFSRLDHVSLAGGYTNMPADIDGMVRYIRPFKRIGPRHLPSFPIAALSADASTQTMKRMPANHSGPESSHFPVPTDDNGRMWIRFTAADFPQFEYADVLSGRVDPGTFRGKTVLVGAAASGIEDFFMVPTPYGRMEISGVRLNAEVIRTIENGEGIVRAPLRAEAAVTVIWAALGFALGGWISPRLSPLFLLSLLAVQAAAVHYMFTVQGIWVAASGPGLGMISAYFAATIKRFVFSTNELAIRQYSLSGIHDLLVPREHFSSYEAYLETNWPGIAARTGIHLLNPRTTLEIPVEKDLHPTEGMSGDGMQALTLVENPRLDFRYQLYIPLPGPDTKEREYTLLGWHKEMPEGRVQSTAAVVLAASWFFSLLKESRARKSMLINTIDAIAAAVDAKDSQTGGHSRRVARVSQELAEYLGLSSEKQEDIYLGGLIHDIGKIGIPDAILTKRGPLTDAEMEVIRTHPDIGKSIMQTVDLPGLTAQAISQHHERCDGSGYPHNLYRADLSLACRIIAVADVFDSMSQERYYKNAMPVNKVLDIIYAQRGVQFDEQVVDALIAVKAPVSWAPPERNIPEKRRAR